MLLRGTKGQLFCSFDHDAITVQTDGAGRYTALAVDNRPLSTYAYAQEPRGTTPRNQGEPRDS